MDFSGKRILITGGSAGIGLALAKALAGRGARLTLLARNPDKLQAAAEVVADHGAAPLTVAADICDVGSLTGGISEAADAMGGLDGLIVNAGYCQPGVFMNMALGDLHRQVNTNLIGAINTLHSALPHVQHGGFVAITSSPAGVLPVYGFAAYNATKAALIALGNTMRFELAARKVSVHLLLPPDTDTPGYANEIVLYPPETKAILAGGTLLSPEKVAQTFVNGIGRGQHTIVAGNQARLALLIQRIAPSVWNRYVWGRIRSVTRP